MPNKLPPGRKLSWYLRIADLNSLKEFSYTWYGRKLDYSNYFSFTSTGDFHFSKKLARAAPEDWNYLLSIIGAYCVGFILLVTGTPDSWEISIWRMEGGSITTCSKELSREYSIQSILESVFAQIREMDDTVIFQHNWDYSGSGDKHAAELEEIDIFSAEKSQSYAAKLHLEMNNEPDENPGVFTRYKMR